MVMVMTNDKVYFCWIMSMGKPWPSKRYGVHTDGNGKEGAVAYSKLLDDFDSQLSLDALAYKYPYERKEDAS